MTDKKGGKKKSFKDLKSFKKSLPSQSAPLSPSRPEPASAPGSKDSCLSFADEMKRLGVTPGFSQEDSGCPSEPDPPSAEAVPTAGPAPLADKDLPDEELFFAALKNFDKVFEEEDFSVLDEPPGPPPARKFRKKRIVPDRQIDLHGMNRKEALLRVRFFLENSAYEGLKTGLIITGRGQGSEGEAVLRQVVEEFLTREGRSWISGWERAPRKLGGEGAIVVFFKEKSA